MQLDSWNVAADCRACQVSNIENVAVKHDFECKRDNYHFKGATRLLTRFPSSMMTVDIIMPQVIPQFSFSPETKHHGAQNQLGSRTWCACKCSLESF
ncbi:uncharacterized protein LOC131062854 isoform X3 [Cryptomeria japonica]|uniref:uncharacterized protein LOC131062854 isoform X3 n=1 Tax=Cryptomeria japonica TaxID=3369 RepID=UPI0027DA6263|nr:uncharacterized protein LOC131062854 isoform X3 [Cryptomeria japonica]